MARVRITICRVSFFIFSAFYAYCFLLSKCTIFIWRKCYLKFKKRYYARAVILLFLFIILCMRVRIFTLFFYCLYIISIFWSSTDFLCNSNNALFQNVVPVDRFHFHSFKHWFSFCRVKFYYLLCLSKLSY